jgi:peptidoglycan/LPS O-acetylase OafA/YrhL
MGRHRANQVKRATHYIPGLDGLRALAVLAVLGYHLLPNVFPGGFIGVDIFFVISGFLITTLLMKEYARTGRINFHTFWVRRARRLLPALFLVVVAASAVAFFVRGDILVGLGRQILGAVTFSNNWVEVAAGSNYFDANSPHLFTNLWSLAVEEQFYVVWPFVLTGVLAMGLAVRHSRKAVLLALGLAAFSAILMAFLYHTTNQTRVYYGTDTHLFGLMIGAALAFWSSSKASGHALRRLSQPFLWLGRKRYLQPMGVVALLGIVVFIIAVRDSAAIIYYGGLAGVCLLSAAALVAIVSKRGRLQCIFTWRPLEWVGERSYGIYLWHWPLLVLFGQALPAAVPDWMVSTVTFIVTMACAALSYRYVEAPIQQNGFRAYTGLGLPRRKLWHWRLRPYPLAIGCLVAVVLTVGAVLQAPSKTQAQMRIEAGQRAIQNLANTQKPEPAQVPTQTIAGTQTNMPSASPKQPTITGADISVIGDSVTIASAPALQERFPGIIIDAEISRSMRRGGMSTIETLNTAGSLRKVVIIALGTNGYYGADNLEKAATLLAGKRLVFVTAHADREWTGPNNDDVRKLAQKYPYVSIAEWDSDIGAHPEMLGDDGIHPSQQGAKIYVESIAKALGL